MEFNPNNNIVTLCLQGMNMASVARSKAAICGHPKPAISITTRDRDFYSFVIE